MTSRFRERIAAAASEKNSRVVLALDPPSNISGLKDFAQKMIDAAEGYICAIKINFHLILPLSAAEIVEINSLAHSYGLQSIADIKLNDIESTNDVAVDHLIRGMKFDSLIANPLIGNDPLRSLVRKASNLGAGVIALVYMSHPGAGEGYGLEVVEGGSKNMLYRIFLDRASRANVDGIVIGATQLDILSEATRKNQPLPVYSPGIGSQGGEIEKAIRSGATYLIVGRSIVEAKEPAKIAKDIQGRALAAVRK
jgi:orotidine-5'-phosphate decarboxylase